MPATTQTPAEIRKAALEQNKALRATAKAENRRNSAEELDTIEANLAAIDEADAAEKAAAASSERDEALLAREKAAEDAASKPRGRKGAPGQPVHQPAVARESVLDDPKRGFKSLADFALEILDCGPGASSVMGNDRLKAAAGTGLTQGVTADGGVLVPPAFRTDIWDGARAASESMLQYCDVNPIDPGVQSVTIPAVNETDRANGSRWGGIRGYWKGELSQLTSSKPAFRDLKVEPQELYVYGFISDKLLRHAPGTASSILARAAADEINFKLGDAIVNGDGAGKPLGFIGHASVVSVAKETGQAAATIVKANIDKMWSRCHANWRAGAVWFINQAVEPELENLSQVVGTGGVPVYLPAGGVADTPNARLKGRPVIPIEYCAALGTVGDIVLANLKSYCVGLRGMVDQASSMHLKFDYAQTAFRFIFEADGQPYLASPITPFKDTSKTLSPIVTLATRA